MLASLVVQEIYGGHIRTSDVKRTPHYWNRIPVGPRAFEVDLTADQFGFDPVVISPQIKQDSDRYSRRQNHPLPDNNPTATRLYRTFRLDLLRELRAAGMTEEATRLERAWSPEDKPHWLVD